MFKVLLLAGLALVSQAAISDFPQFDFSHANCAIEVTYAAQ